VATLAARLQDAPSTSVSQQTRQQHDKDEDDNVSDSELFDELERDEELAGFREKRMEELKAEFSLLNQPYQNGRPSALVSILIRIWCLGWRRYGICVKTNTVGIQRYWMKKKLSKRVRKLPIYPSWLGTEIYWVVHPVADRKRVVWFISIIVISGDVRSWTSILRYVFHFFLYRYRCFIYAFVAYCAQSLQDSFL